jgi:ubiquinone/menaquinone biosynthesis C-methylase UbiE
VDASRSGAVVASAEGLPFGSDTFDSVYSSCAWKHWPHPEAGIAECVRVVRPGGQIVVVEIDGGSTREDFAHLARTSRVPPGLRAAYVRFAMRTVVGVAPTAEELKASLETVATSPVVVERVAGLLFLVAVTTA